MNIDPWGHWARRTRLASRGPHILAEYFRTHVCLITVGEDAHEPSGGLDLDVDDDE